MSNELDSLFLTPKQADEYFAKNCVYAGQMGGIGYDAGYALGCAEELRLWIGKGTSRKTLAMLSLLKQMEDRLKTIKATAAA